MPLPLESCDLVALSAHKIHGPKGIGALWVRDGVTLEPFLHGGGQEGGRPFRHALADALRRLRRGGALAAQRRQDDADHVWRLFARAHELLGDWVAQRRRSTTAITAISTCAATGSTPPA